MNLADGNVSSGFVFALTLYLEKNAGSNVNRQNADCEADIVESLN